MQFPSRDLTQQYISSSYQDVLQQYLRPDLLYILDGYGNVIGSIPSASIGNILITSDVTSSMTVASASTSVIVEVYKESSSFASSSISASWAPMPSIPSTDSASWASSSISASYSEFANIAYIADISFLSDTASISALSDIAISASWASRSLSASWAPMPIIPSTDSASWASSSISSSHSEISLLSYASLTSDYSLDSLHSLTASFALNGGGSGTPIITASIYPITSSWAFNALTASYIAVIPSGSTESASYALTASYALIAGNSGLSIPNYDYSNLTYNGPLGQVSNCTYKVGGSGGMTVCIVTALYSGDIFIGVSKSLG